MSEKPPRDPAEHAEQFAREWRDKLEEYCSVRMQELGIPDNMNGQPDYDGDGKWHAFDSAGRTGGSNTTGVVIDLANRLAGYAEQGRGNHPACLACSRSCSFRSKPSLVSR
jgi:hypothetical protein